MAKTPADRSSEPKRTFVPEGGTGVFGGSARTERTEKFDIDNPIHAGLMRTLEHNPNSKASPERGVSIPLPGEYGKKPAPEAPKAAEKPAKKPAKVAKPVEKPTKPAKPEKPAKTTKPAKPAEVAAEKPVQNVLKPGSAAEKQAKINAHNAALKKARERKNNGL